MLSSQFKFSADRRTDRRTPIKKICPRSIDAGHTHTLVSNNLLIPGVEWSFGMLKISEKDNEILSTHVSLRVMRRLTCVDSISQIHGTWSIHRKKNIYRGLNTISFED